MPKNRSKIPDKIISILKENPTATREDISKRLGVSYQAVQKHIQILAKNKIVIPSFTVASAHIRKYMFWIHILTKFPRDNDLYTQPTKGTSYQKDLCDQIAKTFQEDNERTEGLIFGGTHIVIGGTHDIILRVFSDNPDSVGQYVTEFLRPHPAVQETSTCWSLNKPIP